MSHRTLPMLVGLALAATPIVAANPARADDVIAAIAKAEGHISSENKARFGSAFDEIEAALTVIALRLQEEYAKSFPPAPRGWRRVAPKRGGARYVYRVGRGFQLQRNYFEPTGRRGIMTAQITIDFAELNAHAAKQHAKPREHAKGSRSELVRLKTGTPGFLKYDDRRGVGNMNTLVAGRFYMRVNGTNVKSRDMLIGLMEAWDVAGLRRTAGPAEWRREPIGPLRTARRDYRAGKLGAAFVALEHAATVMARRRAFELAKTIPGAPPGWRVVSTKSTIDGKSRAGRVVVFTRTLAPAPQSAGGSRGKTLSISLNVGRASMMRVIRRLKASSRFNPKAPARKIAVEGAGYATLRYNPERGYGSIHAFVGKTAYLSATGFRLDGPAPLERIMESWNIAALKRALGE